MDKILRDHNVETEYFWIGNKPIGGCIGCNKCIGKGICIFGGPVNDFLDVAERFDGFIFDSPVHWAATSGNIKSFMDRVFFANLMGDAGDSFLSLRLVLP